MNKKKSSVFIAALIGLSLLAGAGAFFPSAERTEASADWSGEPIAEEYSEGERIEIPERRITVGEKTADATAVVILPDGSAKLLSELRLDETGRYTVEYTAEIDGKVYKTTETFVVYPRMAIAGENSEISYGTHPVATDTEGLMLSLAEGERAEFAPIIDVNGATKDETIAEFFLAPTVSAAIDAEEFWIYFTDVEDESSYIKMRGIVSDAGVLTNFTYFLAGGDGQPNMVGYEEAWNVVHKDTRWGTAVAYNMGGLYGGIYQRNGGAVANIRISYDDETESVWINEQRVADLDDEYFVGESLWPGFVSGKVRMSLEAKNYLAETANFVVTKLGDADLSDEKIVDSEAPEIEVERATNHDAVVGGAYPVGKATAFDSTSGNAEVSVSVKYNYPAMNAVTIPVKNGRFKTEKAGRYAIIYTAKDAFGNEAKKVEYITCKESDSPVSLSLDDSALDEILYVGEAKKMPECSASGGYGELTVYIYAEKDGAEILLEDGMFTPTEEGRYTIRYEVMDEVGQRAEKTFEREVKVSPSAVFRGEPELPRYFVSGCSYRIPVFYAYDYSSGKEEKMAAKLSYTDAYGRHEVKENAGFVPMVNANGDKVTLEWTVGETSIRREVECLQILSGDGILVENYFIGDGVGTKKQEDGMVISAESETGGWTFGNDLIANGLSLNFSALPGKSDFEELRIVLTDSEDGNVSVTYRIIPYGDRSKLTLCGRTAVFSGGFTNKSKSNDFVFTYRDGAMTVGSSVLSVKHTDGGESFEGFPSDKVILSMEFAGASKDAQYKVTSISGQSVGELYSDRVKPNIEVLGVYGGSFSYGEKVTLPAIAAGDVLNPSVIAYVTATAPDGKKVVASDGTLINKANPYREYVFTASMYGTYQFEYVAYDSFSGRSHTIAFISRVEDETAPEISFKEPPQTQIRKGEKIVVPEIVVSDDISSAENIRVIRTITSSNGVTTYLPDDCNSLIASYEGIYTIRVTAMDENGNIAVISAEIRVGE